MRPPSFPDSAPLDASSQRLFSLTGRYAPPAVSDMSFAVLYAWQEHFGYRVSCMGDFVLVHYIDGKEMVFLPPFLLNGRIGDAAWPGHFAGLSKKIISWCRENGLSPCMRYVPESYVSAFARVGLVPVHDRDRDDYVYRRADLADLPGGDYAAKRNHVRRFERSFRWHYELLSIDNRPIIRDFMAVRATHHSKGLAAAEPHMIKRMLDNHRLELCGGALYVDDRIVAASAGTVVKDFYYEDGNVPTAIVHAEHADDGVPGAYQMVNRLFAAHLPPEIIYINREEDLGVPGLRKAKLSYRPCRMIRKFRIDLTIAGTGERA